MPVKMPAWLRKWARANDYEPDDLFDELRWNEGAWGFELVSDELVGEEKYFNLVEKVYRHLESGRFVRVEASSLPYGIESYGSIDDAGYEREVVEVFPVEVTVTQYRTKKEMKEKQ